MNKKILSQSGIRQVAAKARKNGKRIVFTNGCFDILHVGHVVYLEKAKALGDILVVGLNSDASVKRLKGEKRPINDGRARAIVLAALSSVDHVVMFSDDTPEKLIECLVPDVLVKGGDWKRDDIVGGKFVKERGGRVVVIPFVKGYSTTSVIEKLPA